MIVLRSYIIFYSNNVVGPTSIVTFVTYRILNTISFKIKFQMTIKSHIKCSAYETVVKVSFIKYVFSYLSRNFESNNVKIHVIVVRLQASALV